MRRGSISDIPFHQQVPRRTIEQKQDRIAVIWKTETRADKILILVTFKATPKAAVKIRRT